MVGIHLSPLSWEGLCPQILKYDDAKAFSFGGTTLYPYETLYLGRGVCGDKALLAASLLKELGYGVALFTYSKESHMTIGIKCPKRYASYGSDYCFAEVANGYYNRITDIPKEYGRFGGIILSSNPEIYVVSEGKSLENVQQDVAEVEDFKYTEKRINDLKQLIANMNPYSDYSTYNALVYEYNLLVNKYNNYIQGG